MSPTTTFVDVGQYRAEVTRPRRSFSRWLRLELRVLLTELRRRRRRRTDLRALQALDDRMLRDIGLDRGQLDAAVHGRR